mgnify:CR=1 FL=1
MAIEYMKTAFSFRIFVTTEPSTDKSVTSDRIEIRWENNFISKNIISALRPVPHGPQFHVPHPPETLEDFSTDASYSGTDDAEFQCDIESESPQKFTQLNSTI